MFINFSIVILVRKCARSPKLRACVFQSGADTDNPFGIIPNWQYDPLKAEGIRDRPNGIWRYSQCRRSPVRLGGQRYQRIICERIANIRLHLPIDTPLKFPGISNPKVQISIGWALIRIIQIVSCQPIAPLLQRVSNDDVIFPNGNFHQY